MADTVSNPARPRSSSVSRRESDRTTGPGLCLRPAFSLIELLIVLAIIATASAIAVPRMIESEARWRVLGAARRVAADVAEARSYAIASSASVIISFESDGYSIQGGKDGQVRAVKLSSRPYTASISSADFAGDMVLTFDGYGAGSADGKITISSDGFQCSVQIDAASGAVKVSDLDRGQIEIIKGDLDAMEVKAK